MAAHLVCLTKAGSAENGQDLNHFNLLAFQDLIFAQKTNNILSCLMEIMWHIIYQYHCHYKLHCYRLQYYIVTHITVN